MRNTLPKRYRIGEVSKITGLPISRLRYYDKIGLLSPRWRDESSEYRFYDAYQLVEAYTIEQYQYFGFSLVQIRLLMDRPSSFFENLEKISSERLDELDKEIAKLEKIRGKLKLMQKHNLKQLDEFNEMNYTICPMLEHSYIMSDIKIDISYASHFAAAINEQIKMYSIDRKLPWYYSDDFYQMSLKNAGHSTVGRFCIRLETDELFDSPLKLYRETAPYCIKYMDTIEIDSIPSHIEKMLSIASDHGYKPHSGYYYLGELVMEAPTKKESAVRQIVLPLTEK